ncbi:hypothetical protein Q5P01_015541 [Channa striata]|uniref:UPAR/Ly6 domain-containing protein n=1 Tax=Channa striata TaxID=64152 RepID=A0AA88MEW4_CHASR|nr:hypothetical protein Q5P01_015541 [Channa striata]
MKVILSLAVLWITSGTAGALQCQTCNNPRCSDTVPVTCSSETMCITATVLATSFGNTSPKVYKACASSALCPALGNHTFSGNMGAFSALANAQCCNTDKCNSATLKLPARQSKNSLRCFSCDPVTSKCTTPFNCQGVEDSCIQVKGECFCKYDFAFCRSLLFTDPNRRLPSIKLNLKIFSPLMGVFSSQTQNSACSRVISGNLF